MVIGFKHQFEDKILMGTKADMDMIAASIQKIYDNVEALMA